VVAAKRYISACPTKRGPPAAIELRRLISETLGDSGLTGTSQIHPTRAAWTTAIRTESRATEGFPLANMPSEFAEISGGSRARKDCAETALVLTQGIWLAATPSRRLPLAGSTL